LIAGSVLAVLVFAGDSVIGLPPGTFYSIIATTISGALIQAGYAIYFGLGLHLVTGTLIGAVFGYVSAAIGPFNIRGKERIDGGHLGRLYLVFSAFYTNHSFSSRARADRDSGPEWHRGI
jgi:hypothetical protein